MNKIILLISLFFSASIFAEQSNGVGVVESMQEYINNYSSKSGVKNNLQTPITGSGSLKTMDGSTSFNAQIGCQASAEYLRATIAPMPTGDVRFLGIEQDTDMDGQLDTVSTPDWTVSGVCANGFIACSAGSWNACRNMIWTADEYDNRIGAYEGALSDLGGCYCINNSCGTGLVWSNLKDVLANLGGGMAAALQQNNPYYGVSGTKVTDTSITMFGTDPTTCGNSSLDSSVGSSSPNNLVSYQSKNASALSNAGSDALESSSLADMLQTSVANNDSKSEYNHCEIKRIVPIDEIVLEDIIGYNTGSGSITTCGADCLLLTIGKVGNNYWGGNCTIYDQYSSFYVKRPDRIKSALINYIKFDDWSQIRINDNIVWSGPYNNWNYKNGRPPGQCELSTEWSQYPNVEFSQYLRQEGNINFHVRTEVTGGGESYVRAQVKVDTQCKLEEDYISDSCQPYKDDSSCVLVSETVDGVDIYKNYTSTGLEPLPSTRTVNGRNCSFDVTRNWFDKKRTYICKSQSNFDIDSIIDRKAAITASANANENDIRDIRKNKDGSITNATLSIQPYTAYAQNSCTSVCKTRKPIPQNYLGTNGVSGALSKNPETYDFSYKECGLENVCPLDEGEEIVSACACSSDFANATAIMQSIRLAGQDMMCTSGTLMPME